MPTLVAVRDVFFDRASALNLLRASAVDSANQDPTRQMLCFLYAGHYDDTALALAAMRCSALNKTSGFMTSALWWPDLAATRQLPDFKNIVRDLGLYDYWRKSGHWGDFARPVGDDDFEIIR
jgi:hypothetical protein